VINTINNSQQQAHEFLKEARWLIITLGTSYSYRLVESAVPVANCHRAPQQWFNKHMMSVEETIIALDTCLYRLFQFNPDLKIIFTVSPVRHIRDGIINNNRSKARLLEAVHHLVNKFGRLYYFPSYEIVIDVLRDYRFYDIDLVHPNYSATSYVIEQFMKYYVNEESVKLSEEVQQIIIARKHKPFQPATEAHKRFLKLHAEKTQALMSEYPFLDLKEELAFFSA
ncbi:MAG: GSCFA domain-containing protein, partial [Chitinophagaceae bacterium]|nr:GSCFA domain-containing protein [Chitinophagaceae bacterium]